MQDIAVNDETSLEISIVSEIMSYYLFTFADTSHRSWGIICTTLSKDRDFIIKYFKPQNFKHKFQKYLPINR